MRNRVASIKDSGLNPECTVSICLFIYLFIYLFIHLFIYLFFYLFFYYLFIIYLFS